MVTPIAQTRLTEEDSVYESSKGFLSGLKHHSRNQTQVNPTLKEMRQSKVTHENKVKTPKLKTPKE